MANRIEIVTGQIEDATIRKVVRADLVGDRAEKKAVDILGGLNMEAFITNSPGEIDRVADELVAAILTQFDAAVKLGKRFAGDIQEIIG